MTADKSFKRLVRARMEKTGESYTAARAMLLAGDGGSPDGAASDAAPPISVAVSAPAAELVPTVPATTPVADRAAPSPLATSDEEIRRRTGRGWEEWFDLLDAWGAPDRAHRDTARWVAEQQGVDPLAWNVQAIVGSYERARGLRAPGEHADGFAITASKTVAVPVGELFDAVADPTARARWLPDADLRERTATKPRSARFDWSDDGTRVHVTFAPKSDSKSLVVVSHERLPDAKAAARMKTYWRERVAALKEVLEA